MSDEILACAFSNSAFNSSYEGMAAAAAAADSRAVAATDFGSSSTLDCEIEVLFCCGVNVSSGDGERLEICAGGAVSGVDMCCLMLVA